MILSLIKVISKWLSTWRWLSCSYQLTVPTAQMVLKNGNSAERANGVDPGRNWRMGARVPDYAVTIISCKPPYGAVKSSRIHKHKEWLYTKINTLLDLLSKHPTKKLWLQQTERHKISLYTQDAITPLYLYITNRLVVCCIIIVHKSLIYNLIYILPNLKGDNSIDLWQKKKWNMEIWGYRPTVTIFIVLTWSSAKQQMSTFSKILNCCFK